jgi:hypothetical protein
MATIDLLEPEPERLKQLTVATRRLEEYLLSSPTEPEIEYAGGKDSRITLYPGYLLAKVNQMKRQKLDPASKERERNRLIGEILDSDIIARLVTKDSSGASDQERMFGSCGFNYLAWTLKELADPDLEDSQTLWGSTRGRELIPAIKKLADAVSKVSSNSEDGAELSILRNIKTNNYEQIRTTFKLTTLALLDGLLRDIEKETSR